MNPPNPKLPKKRHLQFDSSSDSEEDKEISKQFDRYLTVIGADSDKPLSNLNPFLVQKTFEGISKNLKIKKLSKTTLLVEVPNSRISEACQKMKKIGETSISVAPHTTMNSSRGVMRCADLKGLTDSEILKEIRSQNVLEVKRLEILKDKKKVPTNTFFLKFASPQKPDFLLLGYLKVKIEHYYPKPMQCFNCLRFGHLSKYCRNEKICSGCGVPSHEGDCNKKYCINCNEQHDAKSKGCQKFVEETNILKIKIEKNLPYPEARRLYMSTRQQTSYADKTKTKTVTIGTQTEMTSTSSQTKSTTQTQQTSKPKQPNSPQKQPKSPQKQPAKASKPDKTKAPNKDTKTNTTSKHSQETKQAKNKTLTHDKTDKTEKQDISRHNRFDILTDVDDDIYMDTSSSSPTKTDSDRVADRTDASTKKSPHSRSRSSTPTAGRRATSNTNKKSPRRNIIGLKGDPEGGLQQTTSIW